MSLHHLLNIIATYDRTNEGHCPTAMAIHLLKRKTNFTALPSSGSIVRWSFSSLYNQYVQGSPCCWLLYLPVLSLLLCLLSVLFVFLVTFIDIYNKNLLYTRMLVAYVFRIIHPFQAQMTTMIVLVEPELRKKLKVTIQDNLLFKISF